MNSVLGRLAFFLVAALGLACDESRLQSPGNGQGGSDTSGGALGSGGLGAGGAIAGNGAGGSDRNSGGSAAGGALGEGGSPSSGGRIGAGGSMTGGRIGAGGSITGGRTGAGGSITGGRTGAGGNATGGTSGSGGTTCLPGPCPPILCVSGYLLPNPEPCGCPICAPPDAGPGQDAPTDAECVRLPCALPLCPAGYQIVTPPCGCPTCEPVDAGRPDLAGCPPVVCPAIACAGGMLPNPDPCGCPICAPFDAAAETAKPSCVGLDECACWGASGCTTIAEACYCPFPKCSAAGACVCGGGRFVACAPANLNSCTTASARVAALCPRVVGTAFDGLCQQTATACITKCLDEVTGCGDIACSFYEVCDIAADRYTSCLSQCNKALAQ